MQTKFEVTAEPRTVQGKSASRRLRHDGKVPGILYGGGGEPAPIQIGHNHLMLQSEHEAFYSSILLLKIGETRQEVIIKDMQRHPVRPQILHVDFVRISESEMLVMRIPVHFINQDTCPAVKSGGGTVIHYINEVEITCLPKDLPEYINVDMHAVGLGQILHLGELKLPAGVQVYSIFRGGDPMRPVVFIEPPRVVEEAPAAAAAKGKAKAKAGKK